MSLSLYFLIKFMSQSIGLVISWGHECVERFDRGSLKKINRLLEENNISPHKEPQKICQEHLIFPSIDLYTLEYIRYIAARFIEDPNWIPNKKESRKKNASRATSANLPRRNFSSCL